jgi:hypothetical protein
VLSLRLPSFNLRGYGAERHVAALLQTHVSTAGSTALRDVGIPVNQLGFRCGLAPISTSKGVELVVMAE